MDEIKLDSDTKKQGFINYILNFNDENKNSLLNMFQYTFLALPLIIIILKITNYFTPEENNEKGTLEIFSEIFLTLSILLFSIWFINRIIRYIPTYSKSFYSDFNEISFVIPFLILLFTMQTKIGNKINILVDRIIDIYKGNVNLKNNEKNNDNIDVPQHRISQADSLPSMNNQTKEITNRNYVNQVHNNQSSNNQSNNNQLNTNQSNTNQNNVDFNSMFSEPMAANEAFGGFGSSF